MTRFRFRPRFRGLAWSAMILGGALAAAGLALGLGGTSLAFALITGAAGVALGALYLASPTWRIEIAIDDQALEVLAAGDRRFRLPWGEIDRIVASPDTKTCFVDGGDPERSLLVPGPGAQAPYDIEDKEALFDAIVTRAPAGVIEKVPLLRRGAAPSRAKADESGEAPPSGGPREGGEA